MKSPRTQAERVADNRELWERQYTTISVDLGPQTIMQDGLPVTVRAGLQQAMAWLDPITPYEHWLHTRRQLIQSGVLKCLM